MYLVGYLEIGQMAEAAAFFNKSWIPYVDRSTGNFGGDCGGNFLTGAGGFLQGMWAGWAGMRLRIDSLDFLSPRIPTTTHGLKLRGVSYLGLKFDLEIAAGQTCFQAWPGAENQLKTGRLGTPPTVPLGTLPSCYPVGISLRMVGSGKSAAGNPRATKN